MAIIASNALVELRCQQLIFSSGIDVQLSTDMAP